MMVSTLLITAIGTWVTTRLVELRLGADDSSGAADDLPARPSLDGLDAPERRGLAIAGLSVLALTLGLARLWGPAWLGVLDCLPLFGTFGIPDGGKLRNAAPL